MAVPETLRALDQPPGPRIVPSAPVTAGARIEVRLRVGRPRQVVVDPYPFAEPEFSVLLPTRELEDRPYDPATTAAAAFHAAPVRERQVTIGAG